MWIGGSWWVTDPIVKIRLPTTALRVFTLYGQSFEFPANTKREVVRSVLTDFALMHDPDRLPLWFEAYRRGILPPREKALYEDALRRGLIVEIIRDQDQVAEGAAVGKWGPEVSPPKSGPWLEYQHEKPSEREPDRSGTPLTPKYTIVLPSASTRSLKLSDVLDPKPVERQVTDAIGDYHPYFWPVVILHAFGPIVLPPVGLFALALIAMWVVHGFRPYPRRS